MAESISQDFKSQVEAMNNAGYYATSALSIRLDVTPLVRQIEMYLMGAREVMFDSDGNGTPDTKKLEFGEPLVSAQGRQGIMMFVECVFNSQVVQANFPDTKKMDGYTMYAKFLRRTRRDLACHLTKNAKAYGIKPNQFSGLIQTLMRFIEAFMTRALYNKERESYANTIKSVENLQTQPRRNILGLPF